MTQAEGEWSGGTYQRGEIEQVVRSFEQVLAQAPPRTEWLAATVTWGCAHRSVPAFGCRRRSRTSRRSPPGGVGRNRPGSSDLGSGGR